MTTWWVALAGGLGAGTRFFVDSEIRRRLPGPFPWATVTINVTGSFVLGLLTGLVMFRGGPGVVRLLLGTGFCGGYTTFSTASFESVRLLEQRRWGRALSNIFGALILCMLAAAGGLGLAASM